MAWTKSNKRGHSEAFTDTFLSPTDVANSTLRDSENPAKPNEKALFAGFANKAFRVERKGVEPSTSALRTQPHRVLSENQTEVATRDDPRLTNGLTNSPENECGEAGGGSVTTKSNSPTITADSFYAVLAMIASLPLSDAEKADAVRRVLAEQVGSTR